MTNAVAEQLAMGLARLVKEHYDIMRCNGFFLYLAYHALKVFTSSATEWGLMSALLRSTMSHAGAVKISFALIMDLIERESEQAVTPENIAALTSLLETFASAAGQAVEGKRSDARRQVATPLNL